MHKRRPDFDPLKFTPSIIANKINIDVKELAEYFKDHTLQECAKKYGCVSSTIKRKLRSAGYDTSIHNHSDLAKSKYHASKKDIPSDEVVSKLYLEENIDTKTIAEMFGLHYQTIRKIIQRLKLFKNRSLISKSMMSRHLAKYGVMHPAQRPDVIKKTSISLNKASYKGNNFKSITELGYALYLDKNKIEWYYEEMLIPYIDMINGTRRTYVIDFTLIINEKIHWVEVKPNNMMIPEDKRVYASRRAEESNVTYRGLYDSEREDLWKCVEEGYEFEQVQFLYRTPRSSSTKITYYFKSEKEALEFSLIGWKKLVKPTNNGALWKLILIRK